MTEKLNVAACLALLLAGVSGAVASEPASGARQDLIDRGRYIVMIGGCNDCHTAGYLMSEGNIPENQWLAGDSFGWGGPWGTTYASNLRKFMQALTEDQWVAFAKTMQARPPMPWFNLNKMAEEDSRAIYWFVRSLGPSDNSVPAYLPPGEEPSTPYVLFPSPPPAEQEAGQ